MTLRPAALLAELLGTTLLLATIVGSGIMAQSLTQDHGLVLLMNAISISAVLSVLIFLFAPISGAHFNPAVTIAAVIRRKMSWKLGAAYLVSAFIGALSGTAIANLMFGLPAIQIAHRERTGAGLWLGELVATAVLILIVCLLDDRGQSRLAPTVIPLWILGAIVFASSTAFANPAVTFGRVFTDTFAAISADSILGFLGAQLAGVFLGVFLAKLLRVSMHLNQSPISIEEQP